MHLLVIAGKFDVACKLGLDIMPLYGIHPDIVTFNVLARGLADAGDVLGAADCVNRLTEVSWLVVGVC